MAADFVRHEPCPNCGSSDALGRYSDGSAHCFTKCGYNERANGSKLEATEETQQKDWTPLQGTYSALSKRGIDEETCKHHEYMVGEYNGQPCQIANVRDENRKLVAQKLRLPGKQFTTLGNGRDLPLIGMWLWGGGKHLVITEGEMDMLSMSKAFENKWPVVSLPNGAQSAAKAIKRSYEWLEKFDRIVLMFDMDTPGQAAAQEVAAMLPPGRVSIAQLSEKDANEVLLADGPGPLIRAFWNAKEWRPDGIKHVKELETDFLNPPLVRGIPYPWQQWNDVLGLMRLGSLVTLTAGTGIGKSTLLRELAYHALVTHNEPIGALFLEEDNVETLEGLVSIHLSKNIMLDRTMASKEETKEAFEFLKSKPLYLYDHFGSSEIDNICDKIRYLVKACGVRWIFLDHLSILVSGLDGDERRTIDMAMTKLRTLVSELKCGMFCVVHLRRPQGDRGHEDGEEVRLGQLRGSHSIAQLSDAVVGLNKDAENPHGDNINPVCIKNRRNGGRKGSMGQLTYDRMSGRLTDCVF